jgi:hypothetical protein
MFLNCFKDHCVFAEDRKHVSNIAFITYFLLEVRFEESLSSMELAIALTRNASFFFSPYLLLIFPSFTVRKIMAHYTTR